MKQWPWPPMTEHPQTTRAALLRAAVLSAAHSENTSSARISEKATGRTPMMYRFWPVS
jgi:hypothetical protein